MYEMKVAPRPGFAGHNVRDAPSINGKALFQINTGDVVQVKEEALPWVRIVLPDGRGTDKDIWTVTVWNGQTCLERIN